MGEADGYLAPLRLYTRRMQTVASVGLAVALLGLSGVAMWSSFATNAAARTSQRSQALAGAYSAARFGVGDEESLESSYRLKPSLQVRAEHATAHGSVDAAMDSVATLGNATDRAIAADVQRQNAKYAAVTRLLFRAVDRGDVQTERILDEVVADPIFTAMQSIVYTQADRHTQIAEAAGRRLLLVEAVARWATSAAVAAGLLLIIVFASLRRRYDRENLEQTRRNLHQATHDALTGLPNRLLFARMLDHALTEARRGRRRVAVALLDLDRFKEVNDTLGHRVGDLLLQQIGPRIDAALRPGDLLARLGGDEFAVLIRTYPTDEGTQAEPAAVARRVLDALRTPFLVDGVNLVVEASAGLACFPADGDTGELLLQRADVAMYVAKTNHEALAVYDQAHDDHDAGKLALLAELRSALRHDELVLHYQPLVDIASHRVKAVEALVRWQHPVLGLLPPAAFIGLAESSGLIHELTRSVLTRAVRDAKSWEQAGRPLRVSVNISARCLLDSALPETVTGVLAAAGLPVELLKLEITESAIIADPARAQGVIRRLHNSGIALSIDDFGTGYTSLAYLRDLPVQELKIDQSFVTDMLVEPKDAVIVRTAIELAQRLGLDSVAEGIEDPAVLLRLAALGCTTAQGYHISRPLLEAELLAWIPIWESAHPAHPAQPSHPAQPAHPVHPAQPGNPVPVPRQNHPSPQTHR